MIPVSPMVERMLDVSLIGMFLSGIFGSIWFPEQWIFKVLLGIAVFGMSCVLRPDREFFSPAFFDCWRSFREWRRVLLVTLVMGLILAILSRAVLGWETGGWNAIRSRSLSDWLTIKLPTVFLQQWMVQILLVPVLTRLLVRPHLATLTGAAIFSIIHFPNPILMLLTLVAGCVWISCFQLGRQILPITLSHFVLAVLATGLCGEYLLNMRVGPDCLALYPQKITRAQYPDGLVAYELPNCVEGCVETMIQEGTSLRMTGWTEDRIYGDPPEAFFLECNGALVRIEEARFSSQAWPPDGVSNEKQKNRYAVFGFELLLDTNQLPPGVEGFIWAANRNGWLARLGQKGRIASMHGLPEKYRFVQFPVQIDGRVTQIHGDQKEITVQGWASQYQSDLSPEAVLVTVPGREFLVKMEHLPVSSSTVGDGEPARQPFRLKLPFIPGFTLRDIRCFAIDQQAQLHRVFLTPNVNRRLAQEASSSKAAIIR